MDSHIDKASPLDAQTLALVFAHIDTAVIIASLDRKIVSMNDAAKALFSYVDQDVFNQSTRMLYANEQDFYNLGKSRFNDSADYIDEYDIATYKSKLGYEFKGQVTGGPIKDADGNNLFYVAMIQDYTSRLNAEETLNKLHSITSSRQLSYKQRLHAILSLGSEHFGLPIGIVSKIDGDNYVIQQAIHPENQLEEQMTFDLGETYCTHVYEANDVKGFHSVVHSEIERHPCYQNFGLEAYIGASIFVDGTRFGTLNFSSLHPTKPFIRQDYELIRLFAEWIGHEIARNDDITALELAHNQLETLANIDALTGLANRGYVERLLNENINSSHNSANDLIIALFDFDHFKSINDTYGHAVGDAALKQFAKTAQQSSQHNDVYGRWGGEEFLAIFPSAEMGSVVASLERLMADIRQSALDNISDPIQLTVSVGVTKLNYDDNFDSLLKRVDDLLYKAKNLGRDRIEIG